MEALIDWTRSALDSGELHPLLVIGIFVATFLAIHPFQDGNGRLSRILTTLLPLKAGYAHVPYSSLESVVEQSKAAYYVALRRTQRTLGTDSPEWEPWLVYFLTALRRQKNRLQQRIDRERLILGNLPDQSVQILDIARDTGRVSIANAVRVTGASRNTIKGTCRHSAPQAISIGTGPGAERGIRSREATTASAAPRPSVQRRRQCQSFGRTRAPNGPRERWRPARGSRRCCGLT